MQDLAAERRKHKAHGASRGYGKVTIYQPRSGDSEKPHCCRRSAAFWSGLIWIPGARAPGFMLSPLRGWLLSDDFRPQWMANPPSTTCVDTNAQRESEVCS